MHYDGISRTDIGKAIEESRIEVSKIMRERDYSIYSEVPKWLNESRAVIDKIMKERYK